MNWISLLMLGALMSPSAFAQHRCVEDGKTVFSDRPCAGDVVSSPPTGNSPKVIGDPSNAAYSTPYGDWRGQLQFQASKNGQPIPEAHAVVPAVLSIDPQGKVTGMAPENGCKFVGIAAPGLTKFMLSIDVTMSGCKYKGLSRRLFGSLSIYPAEKHSQFWIYAHPVDLLDPGYSFDIKGTLRR